MLKILSWEWLSFWGVAWFKVFSLHYSAVIKADVAIPHSMYKVTYYYSNFVISKGSLLSANSCKFVSLSQK